MSISSETIYSAPLSGGEATSPAVMDNGLLVPKTPVNLVFSGSRGRIVYRLLVNLVLTILTLGLYGFWAKTNIRAFYVNNTALADTAFAFQGRGSQLLGGSIIVGVLLSVILSVIYLWETLKPEDAVLLQILTVVGFLFLIPLSRAMRWRYLLGRTEWRAIRFHFPRQGDSMIFSGIGYALGVTALRLLSILTMGLTLPYLHHFRYSYLINRSGFGNLPARFIGKRSQLMRLWMLPWLSGMMCLAAAAIVGALILFAFPKGRLDFLPAFLADYQQATVDLLATIPPLAIVGLFGVSALITYALYTSYKIRMLEHFVNKSFFEESFFTCKIPVGDLLGIIFTYHILLWGSFALFVVFFFTTGDAATAIAGEFSALFWLGGAASLVIFLRYLVYHTHFLIPALECLTAAIKVRNADKLEEAMQSRQKGGALGEGLAEALGV